MELIRISTDKLKIVLSEADMKEHTLTCETMDYDNTETRRAFWSILDEAKHRTGFDAAAGRVLIQVYPLRHGGCEMYVTRLNAEADGAGEVACTVDEAPWDDKLSVFRFSSLRELTEACFQLHCAAYDGDSAAYCAGEPGGGRAYYLLLHGGRNAACMCEYGSKRNSDLIQPYLAEYGSVLCEKNAVAAFSGLH